MALPILAKKITSALVKKGSDAKKESKNVSTEKLLPGSSDNKKAKVSKFKSKTPRPYRKKFQPTKFLPPSKIDENFDMAKLDDLLASLVSNTEDLKKATEKDVDDTKKRGRKKRDISQKLKRQSREGRIESKAAKPKVVKAQAPLKLPKAPDFFKDILGVAGRLVIATGVMSILNFFTDPEKKDGFINLISNHMDKIILGALGALAVAIGSSLLPMFGIATTLFSLLLPVVSGMVGLLLNPGVWAAVLTALAIKSELDRPAGEYDQLEGDNAAWKNPRLTSRQRVITVATIYGKDRSQWPKEVVEELNRLNEQSDKRDKDATKYPLPGILSGGPLYSDPSQYQDPGDLTDILPNVPDSYRNSTSNPTEVKPMVKPQTEVLPGVKLGGLEGDSGSVSYEGQERAPLSTQYSPFAQSDIDEQGMSIISGKGYRRSTDSDHKGFDIPAIEGTPVYAYLPGEITQNRYARGYGNIVEWRDSKYGQTHMFAHLKEPGPLSVGTKFEAGTMLARTGDTGTPGSYHLHWEIGAQGSEVDPGEWVKKHPINFSSTPKDQNVNYQTSYETSGTQVAFVKVPTPTPVPMSSGETVESGGFIGGSSSNVNSYENLVLSSHYREA